VVRLRRETASAGKDDKSRTTPPEEEEVHARTRPSFVKRMYRVAPRSDSAEETVITCLASSGNPPEFDTYDVSHGVKILSVTGRRKTRASFRQTSESPRRSFRVPSFVIRGLYCRGDFAVSDFVPLDVLQFVAFCSSRCRRTQCVNRDDFFLP